MEIAEGGDLMGLYNEKREQKYEFKLGLKVILGAAKGLAHMHTMPAPYVHRDVKSANIMVMGDGAGKLGDCGESRRIDLSSTMTQTGSPLWAAPELLSGKRYCEDVDTYSLGAPCYSFSLRMPISLSLIYSSIHPSAHPSIHPSILYFRRRDVRDRHARAAPFQCHRRVQDEAWKERCTGADARNRKRRSQARPFEQED